MSRDQEKARARKRRYLERKKIEKFGPEAAGRDMRGRHGNNRKGSANPRWNPSRIVSSQGYVLVRVDPTHPRSFGPPRLKRFKYAYEHDIVMERRLGRHLAPDEIVHHRNGDRADNRPENLEVETRSAHAREHVSVDGTRDSYGRFSSRPRLRDRKGADMSEWPSDLRVRQFPGRLP